MKVTTKELRKIISEEVNKIMVEMDEPQLNLPFDLPPIKPSTGSPVVDDGDEKQKLVKAFEKLLDDLSSRFNPVTRKIDTVPELVPILKALIDAISEATKGALTSQEIITSLTKLRSNMVKDASS